MAIAVSIGTFIATLLGGLFALYQQDRLHLILGFSAGALIGVAFFDLIPEALDLGSAALGTQLVVTTIAVGFVAYMLLDRTIHQMATKVLEPRSCGDAARSAPVACQRTAFSMDLQSVLPSKSRRPLAPSSLPRCLRTTFPTASIR